MNKEHYEKFDKAIDEYNKTNKEQLSLLDIALSAITIEAYERGDFNG